MIDFATAQVCAEPQRDRKRCGPAAGGRVRTLHALTSLYSGMTKIEQLEHEVEALSGSELTEFRRWFLEFDATAWDEQFETNVRTGALDALADQAIAEHRQGGSRAL